MGLRKNIDLEPVHLKTVSRLLDLHLRGSEVWAYGSRVDWTSHPASDLDLVAFVSSDQESKVMRLREALEESSLPFRVDVHIWDRLPNSFHERITKNYVVLRDPYSSEQAKSTFIESPLGDFAPLAYGKGLPASKRTTEGKVPVYGSNGIVGHHDTALSAGPTVIVGRKGTIGAVHYSSIPCWPIDTTFYCEGTDKELVRFKYYALKSLQLDKMNSDSAVPGLNRTHAHSLNLPIPPEGEQRFIARALGSLDDRIELNRRMSETLEEMARALFRSWFVDFDPVRAKVEGRSSGLPPDIDALFPADFEESELGEIPAGWSVLPLRDLVELFRDSEEPMSSPDAVFEHYSIPAFDRDQLPIQEYGRNIKSRKFRVPSRAVLLSRLNPDIERVWLVATKADEKAICSTEFMVLRSQPPIQDSYIYCLARSRPFRDSIGSLVTGTSRSHQRAGSGALLSLSVLSPTTSILGEFDRQTRAILDQSLNCRRASRSIAEQRDSLMPLLLSGKLRAGDAKRPAMAPA